MRERGSVQVLTIYTTHTITSATLWPEQVMCSAHFQSGGEIDSSLNEKSCKVILQRDMRTGRPLIQWTYYKREAFWNGQPISSATTHSWGMWVFKLAGSALLQGRREGRREEGREDWDLGNTMSPPHPHQQPRVWEGFTLALSVPGIQFGVPNT